MIAKEGRKYEKKYEKKYISEFIGTFILVFIGCGTVVVLGGFTGGTGVGILGVVGIALAFALSIVAAAYAIGPVSGCHVNPAVTVAMWFTNKLSTEDLIGYVVAQIVGALAGSGVLALVVANSDSLSGTGANGYSALSALGLTLTCAIVVEIVLIWVFLLAIFGVTSEKTTAHMGGIVIGLTLTLVHWIGIPLTGTSVNPARSISAAVLAGGEALGQVWVFIVAPLVGAILAAHIYKNLMQRD